MSAAAALASQRLAIDEGLRLKVYDDATGTSIAKGSSVKGNPTVGYGRDLASAGITKDEATYLLGNDLNSREQSLVRYPWYAALDATRQSVCLELAFNLGLEGFLEFRGVVWALQAKNWQGAHNALLASAAARQLPARYEQLAELLLTG